jgi:hypothetical protein
MVILMELVAGHVPFVVNVTVYVPSALAPRLISPVVVFTNTKPAGNAEKVTADPPVIVATGFDPVAQYVPDE